MLLFLLIVDFSKLNFQQVVNCDETSLLASFYNKKDNLCRVGERFEFLFLKANHLLYQVSLLLLTDPLSLKVQTSDKYSFNRSPPD